MPIHGEENSKYRGNWDIRNSNLFVFLTLERNCSLFLRFPDKAMSKDVMDLKSFCVLCTKESHFARAREKHGAFNRV